MRDARLDAEILRIVGEAKAGEIGRIDGVPGGGKVIDIAAELDFGRRAWQLAMQHEERRPASRLQIMRSEPANAREALFRHRLFPPLPDS